MYNFIMYLCYQPSVSQKYLLRTPCSRSTIFIESENVSRSLISDSLHSHGLQPTGLPYPWNFPGKDTAVGCHSLLQATVLTQGLNAGLLHFRQILYF